MFVCKRCASRLASPASRATSIKETDLLRLNSLARPSLDATRQYPVFASVEVPQSSNKSASTGTSSSVRCFSRVDRALSSTQASRPFRVAIIGSGPAGFYAAIRLLKFHHATKIDMYDKLPVPFGLVRYGVAPDHPEVKNCQDRFEEVAASPNFEFCGNIDVGGKIALDVIKRNYDAIMFTYGANEDRKLGIPGEDLKGVWSARDFVAWYNGLPGYAELDFDLAKGKDACIIGQGNVALDVARILLTPVDQLRKTEMPEYALEALSHSRVKHVTAIGRRGPLQAACTIKEIRELTVIPDVSFLPVDQRFFPADLQSLPRARRRIAELLVKTSERAPSVEKPKKQFSLLFLHAPLEFLPHPIIHDLGGIRLQGQQFADTGDHYQPDAAVTAETTSESIDVAPTSLAFRSIGYKSNPLFGMRKLGIHFDFARGIIPNEGGRIVQHSTQPGLEIDRAIPGLYVAGWVKRGPTGVIASTMEDAFATADALTRDIEIGKPFMHGGLDAGAARGGWEGVEAELRAKGRSFRRTTWKDWREIDRVERERGAKLGKEREKITSVAEMLQVIDG